MIIKLWKIITNCIIVTASLFISLCFAEWFVRSYMPSPDYGGGKRPALYSNLFEFDPLIGWRGVPNVNSPYFSKDFKVTINHDRYGYRNISPPYVKGKKNYLLLGDSYGWGWGVEDNETAAAVFNKSYSDMNIYSLGIPGYGTDQEYLALKKFLAEHSNEKFSGVVLLFYYNDFENNAMPESYRYQKPFFVLDEKNQLVLKNTPVPYKAVAQDARIDIEPQPDTLLQQSQLLNLLKSTLISAIFKHPPKSTEELQNQLKHSEWEESNIKLSSRIISELKEFCTKNNLTFHLVYLVTQNTDEHPASMISSLQKELDLPDTQYSFFYSRKFPRTDLWLDTHYTPYGQNLLAEHIGNALSQRQ